MYYYANLNNLNLSLPFEIKSNGAYAKSALDPFMDILTEYIQSGEFVISQDKDYVLSHAIGLEKLNKCETMITEYKRLLNSDLFDYDGGVDGVCTEGQFKGINKSDILIQITEILDNVKSLENTFLNSKIETLENELY